MNVHTFGTNVQAAAISEFRKPVQAPRTSPVAIDSPETQSGATSFRSLLKSAGFEPSGARNNVALDVHHGVDLETL
jgi:hypothetical protein